MERIAHHDLPKGILDGMLVSEKFLAQSGLKKSLMHLMKIRASQINGCGYCLDMHFKEALKSGEDHYRLNLIAAWQEAPCFTEEEKIVLSFTEILTNMQENQLPVVFKQLNRFFSKAQIASLSLVIAQINGWNRLMVSFGTIPGSYKT